MNLILYLNKFNVKIHQKRSGCKMVFYNNDVIMFGGTDKDGKADDTFYRCNLIKNEWIRKMNFNGKLPSGRRDFSFHIYNDYLILFGGTLEESKN